MPQPTPKFFKRQSGQMKAVREEVQAILDVTREVFDKVKSDPPPPVIFKRPPPEAGVYKMVPGETEGELILVEGGEQVVLPKPASGSKPEIQVPPRPRSGSKPEIQVPPPRKKLGSHSNEG